MKGWVEANAKRPTSLYSALQLVWVPGHAQSGQLGAPEGPTSIYGLLDEGVGSGHKHDGERSRPEALVRPSCLQPVHQPQLTQHL